MKRKKAEVEEHESSLDKEEKILEGIRDSLKGKLFIYFVTLVVMMHRTFEDKTQVFHDQIEGSRQSFSHGWRRSIQSKLGWMSHPVSETPWRSRREGVKRACQEAQEALELIRRRK